MKFGGCKHTRYRDTGVAVNAITNADRISATSLHYRGAAAAGVLFALLMGGCLIIVRVAVPPLVKARLDLFLGHAIEAPSPENLPTPK